jgi:pimeloyl-ACP methyl ester carboxylesterase
MHSDDDELIQRLAPAAMPVFYPQAKVHTFHKANHIPLITRRDEYIEVVKQFLRER